MKRLMTLMTSAAWLALAAACAQQTAEPVAPQQTPVERGAYLVNAMGCNDCHTPWIMGPNGPEPDMTRMLSGHPEGMQLPAPPAVDPASGWAWVGAGSNTAFAGPWGISYTMNLTPDENTGLGIWTEEMFVTAIREGKHMGTSRPILPPMPWPAFRNLNDDDLKGIFAFLRTIPAIENHVPEPVIAQPQ